MITANSRYSTSTVSRMTDSRGATRNTITLSSPASRTISYTSYRVVDGDTIQAIAFRALGDPTQWWRIADVNPEILAWYALVPGTVIRIPS